MNGDAKRNALVERLALAYGESGRALRVLADRELPSPAEVAQLTDSLRELVFPEFVSPKPRDLRSFAAQRLADIEPRLQRQVFLGLGFECGPDTAPCARRAREIVLEFLDTLPRLRARLDADAAAAFEADPAASGAHEVVFCYPGLLAITIHRMAHELVRAGAAVIPRMMSEYAHDRTGIDIHPGATIGDGFFIDHGTGVVIGETTEIGDRVRIYQGVTLGALSLPTGTARSLHGKKRHPTIEHDVIIYANATILGGQTRIGRGAVIGGNCWITESVPPLARVTKG